MERCLEKNLVFKDCFGSFLKKHEESFDIVIDEIFRLVDGPIIRFMKKYKIKYIPEDLHDIFYIPGVNTQDPDYYPFVRFHTATHHYYMLRPLTNNYRLNKINKEEFKKKLKHSIVRDFYTSERLGESQENIRNMMYTFYILSKKHYPYFSKVFNTNDGVFFIALRDYILYYHILDDSKIDKSNAIKLCDKPKKVEKETEGILVNTAGLKGWRTVDTVSILPDMEKYNGNWNNGVNYCFSGSHRGITALKWLANGIAIAIDIGVAMTGVGLLVEAPVAVITGGGAAWASRYLGEWEKWPRH